MGWDFFFVYSHHFPNAFFTAFTPASPKTCFTAAFVSIFALRITLRYRAMCKQIATACLTVAPCQINIIKNLRYVSTHAHVFNPPYA